MKSFEKVLRATLTAALFASLGAVACGGDDDSDKKTGDTVGGCIDACTNDASTCRAACSEDGCSAGCDSDFDACKAACDGK